MTLKPIKIEACHVCWNHQHPPCRCKLEFSSVQFTRNSRLREGAPLQQAGSKCCKRKKKISQETWRQNPIKCTLCTWFTIYTKSHFTVKNPQAPDHKCAACRPLTKIDDARGRSVRYTKVQYVIIHKTDKRTQLQSVLYISVTHTYWWCTKHVVSTCHTKKSSALFYSEDKEQL